MSNIIGAEEKIDGLNKEVDRLTAENDRLGKLYGELRRDNDALRVENRKLASVSEKSRQQFVMLSGTINELKMLLAVSRRFSRATDTFWIEKIRVRAQVRGDHDPVFKKVDDRIWDLTVNNEDVTYERLSKEFAHDEAALKIIDEVFTDEGTIWKRFEESVGMDGNL